MIRIDCQQGDAVWRQHRIGIPTASQFDRILTSRKKPSASGRAYRHELLTEWLLGIPLDRGSSAFMARGHDLESEALAWYSWTQGVKVERVGLILRDDRMAGCSPDGLIGEDCGIEVKCLSAVNHVAALVEADDADHVCQVQGCLWLTGRQRWVRLYYSPSLPPLALTFERNDEFIAVLSQAVDLFVADLLAAREYLRTKWECVPREPYVEDDIPLTDPRYAQPPGTQRVEDESAAAMMAQQPIDPELGF